MSKNSNKMSTNEQNKPNNPNIILNSNKSDILETLLLDSGMFDIIYKNQNKLETHIEFNLVPLKYERDNNPENRSELNDSNSYKSDGW